jgi:hypothetical protein
MRLRLAVVAMSVSLLAFGCALGGQSKPARAQEAALELNLNARFGRMELAAERVAPKARDQFFDRRKGWGNDIRVADYDLTGLKMQGEEDADTFVKVAWYRANEGDLRVTTLKQRWHDFKGDWKLTEEQRIDGDLGLLGEPRAAASPGATPAPPRRAQFPTIYLGSGSGPSAEAAPPPASLPASPAAQPSPEPPPAAFGEPPPPGAPR